MMRYLKWCLLLVVLVPVAFLGLYLLEIWRHEHGYSSSGAEHKWFLAMHSGDAEKAKYWAEQALRHSSDPGDRGDFSDDRAYAYLLLATADEFAGEYEDALRLYRDDATTSLSVRFPSPAPAALGRVYYKLGRRADAFRAYCEYSVEFKHSFPAHRSEVSAEDLRMIFPGDPQFLLEREPGQLAMDEEVRAYEEEMGRAPWILQLLRDREPGLATDEELGGFMKAYREKTGRSAFPYELRLCPFRTYGEFRDFMQDEWQKTGNAEEYREAMEFLESVELTESG